MLLTKIPPVVPARLNILKIPFEKCGFFWFVGLAEKLSVTRCVWDSQTKAWRLRQNPLLVDILFIFGGRFLIFFVWKVSEK